VKSMTYYIYNASPLF